METDLQVIELNPRTERILFTERAIIASTFLGGPLSAVYLIATNFHELGDDDAKRLTWRLGLGVAIVLITAFVLIPDEYFPRGLERGFHLIWSLGAFLVVRRFQKRAIQDHVESGGKKGSAWKAAGVGLVSGVLIVGYILLLSSITTSEPLESIPEPSAKIVMELSRCTVSYDTANVTGGDARIAGGVLEANGIFPPQSGNRSALLYRIENRYVIVMTSTKVGLTDESVSQILQDVIADLERSYSSRQYEIRLIHVDSSGNPEERFITGGL